MISLRTPTAVVFAALLAASGCSFEGAPEHPKSLEEIGLTERGVMDCYVYLLARHLVLRQEHVDLAEEGIDYNVIQYNELGQAEFVNPNLDVAYLECWFAVDETTPVVLEVPEIQDRYYVVQIVDEWAEIVTNINERNYPDHPHGSFALCLEGSTPVIPEGAVRIDLPSKKAKMLARVEGEGDDAGATLLQHAFKIVSAGQPAIEPAVEIPSFTNQELPGAEIFDEPLLDRVLASAKDTMSTAAEHQHQVAIVNEFLAADEANRKIVETVIREKALLHLKAFLENGGDNRGGWNCTRQWKRFGNDFLFRCAANYAGIWWNSSEEVVYYLGMKDSTGDPLAGNRSYTIRYAPEDLPQNHVDAFWSLTLLSLPDYQVIPNDLERYHLSTESPLELGADGSLTIYLAPELPAGAPAANWLPTPAGKNFTLNHRFYVPKKEVLTGEWYVPPIEVRAGGQ